jgi:hypothetical protein
MADECPPIGNPCGSTVEQRLQAMESRLSVGLAQIAGFNQRLCQVENNLIASFTLEENGVISITYGNGNVVSTTSPYLQQLLTAVNTAINDTNKIVGGEITVDGVLKLFRPNSVEVILGNIVDIVNPARNIQIRNDGRIEITLKDGTTKFATDATIQSAVSIPASGGGGDFGMSVLGTPATMATATAPGQTGSVDIASLPGVTVPVGATHVLISAELQYLGVNLNESERDANYATAVVEGKEVVFSGRRNPNGSEPTFGNYDINNVNHGYAYIALPGDNTLDYEVHTYVGATVDGALSTRKNLRVIFKVLAFVINGGSQ